MSTIEVPYSPRNNTWVKVSMPEFLDLEPWLMKEIKKAHSAVINKELLLPKCIGFAKEDISKILVREKDTLGWIIFSLIKCCRKLDRNDADKCADDQEFISLFAFGQDNSGRREGYRLSKPYEKFIGAHLDIFDDPGKVFGKQIRVIKETRVYENTSYSWDIGIDPEVEREFAKILLDSGADLKKKIGMYFFVRMEKSMVERICKINECKTIAIMPLAADCRVERSYPSPMGDIYFSGFYEQKYTTAFIVPLDKDNKILYPSPIGDEHDHTFHFSGVPWEPSYEEWTPRLLNSAKKTS